MTQHRVHTDFPTMARIRRRGVLLLLAAALGAAVTAWAPAAHATVIRVGVMPDINYGPLTNYGTGCTYTAEAVLTSAVGAVTFYDNGVPFATVAPTGGVALVTWIPATRGAHVLTAAQGTDAPTAGVEVPVGVGMPIGTSCLVI